MKFRSATQRDIDAIERIYDRIHAEEQAGRACIGWQAGVYPVRATAEGALSRGELYVAETENGIVGSAIVNGTQLEAYDRVQWSCPAAPEEVLVLHTLTIDPTEKGKGYGRAFARFYEQLARERGCRALRIDTQEKNLAARALYRSLGYTEVGIVPTDFNGISTVQLVLLERVL